MKKFFVRAFAVIGFLFTAVFLFAGLSQGYMLWHASKSRAPKAMVLMIDFGRPLVEKELVAPFDILMHMDQETMPLFSVVRALERAKDDPRVKAVVARFGATQPSLVHAQEVREALRKFNQSGKPSFAFAPTYGDFGMANRTYYLASAFNEVWLQPVGTVGLTGVGLEAPFTKTALGNIGVTAEFFQREEHKSAMETFTRDSFSAEARADLEKILKNFSDQQIQGIAENRGWDPAKVQMLVAKGPFTATEAMQENLVTRVGYEDELLQQVEDKFGKEAEAVDVTSYLDMTNKGKSPKATVAVITGTGMIIEEPTGPRQFAESEVMDAISVVDAFHEAVEDENVKAIIFRIDSPGGSPVASESIRRAVVRAKAAQKPVFVSMGEVAASGGYWVAMNADRIVASPGTLTGSIGVVAGKFVTNGLWDKLGIKWDRMATNDNAHLWSAVTPYDAYGRDRMNALLDETYQAFLSNVSAARKIPMEKMPDIAKGRVWTGEQALKIGLVDELGGMATTVAAVKKQLNLEPTDPILLQSFPAPISTTEYVLQLLKNLGVEGVSFQNFFSEMRSFRESIAPLREVLTTSPIAARAPESLTKLAR